MLLFYTCCPSTDGVILPPAHPLTEKAHFSPSSSNKHQDGHIEHNHTVTRQSKTLRLPRKALSQCFSCICSKQLVDQGAAKHNACNCFISTEPAGAQRMQFNSSCRALLSTATGNKHTLCT
ncbi:unnamed protein product [Ectocarpus sp. 12 AP-2014]